MINYHFQGLVNQILMVMDALRKHSLCCRYLCALKHNKTFYYTPFLAELQKKLVIHSLVGKKARPSDLAS